MAEGLTTKVLMVEGLMTEGLVGRPRQHVYPPVADPHPTARYRYVIPRNQNDRQCKTFVKQSVSLAMHLSII